MRETLTTVLPENSTTHKEATWGFLREHRDNLLRDDKWIIPQDLARELKELNSQMDEPLEIKEVNSIVSETDFKRGLVPPERTRAYLLDRGREYDNDDLVMQDILLHINGLNRRNCEQRLSEGELRQIATEVKEGTADEITGEVGTLMSEVEAETVEWLWGSRIPLGKLTILDGDPGLGKSVITMDLAARVTTGASFPNGYLGDVDHVGNLDHLDHLGGVVILSAEDGLADTIRPRLDAVGADVSRVVAISTVPDREGNERTIAIPEDIGTIEAAIRRVDAKLVIIDPLMAFLSGKANYDQDVRKALTPLSRMAESMGVAVLVVRHLNKQQGGKALYRGGSSIGIIGAARSGLVVETHPDNSDLRVLATSKSNLAEKAASLTYSITTAENNTAKVAWGKATGLDADDILNPDTSEVGKAKDWLALQLRDMPIPALTIKADAKEAGISEKTLYRAKDALGVKSLKDGFGGSWRWHPVEDGQGGQGSQHSQDGLMVAS